jgi:hypothetical protein
MPPGMLLYICEACGKRWHESAGFRRDHVERIEEAALQKIIADARPLFARIGVFELPRTFAEFDEAIGAPPGTTERAARAMFGGNG